MLGNPGGCHIPWQSSQLIFQRPSLAKISGMPYSPVKFTTDFQKLPLQAVQFTVELGQCGVELYDGSYFFSSVPLFQSSHVQCCRHAEILGSRDGLGVQESIHLPAVWLSPPPSPLPPPPPCSILGVVSLVYITVVMIVKYFILLANGSVYECSHHRSIPS